MNNVQKLFLVLLALMVLTGTAIAKDSDDRAIVIRGCVDAASKDAITPNRSLLVWSTGDVMLSNVVTEMASSRGNVKGQPYAVAGTAGGSETMFYWLESTDSLEKHIGEAVEITGKLGKEINQAKIEVDPKDHYTEIKFKSNGHDVKARVPAGMLGETSKADFEYRVIIRDVDVKNVHRLSRSCAAQ